MHIKKCPIINTHNFYKFFYFLLFFFFFFSVFDGISTLYILICESNVLLITNIKWKLI